jgi:hypothetical protein
MKLFKLPENSVSIKMLGKNIIDVLLNSPVTFIPRGNNAVILSFIVKDSGNYLIIWKVKGRDTTSFYPNRPETLAIDSSASVCFSINGKDTGVPKNFLQKQLMKAKDSLNDKINFLPIPLDCSEVAHLNQNDTVSVTAFLNGFPKFDFSLTHMNLPVKLLETCEIDASEIILIRIDDKN